MSRNLLVDESDNFFFQVTTLQKAMNGAWQFYGPLCKYSNKMYDNFQEKPGQIGMTVQLKSPWQFVATDSLEVSDFGAIIDQTFPLTVDKQISVNLGYNVQQQIYDMGAEGYMNEIGINAASAFGGRVEKNIAARVPFNTYRGYGDGLTPINSYGMLADLIERFHDLGMPRDEVRVILLNTIFPQIVDTGNNQFTPNRNEKNSNMYDVGDFSGASFHKANTLATHTAGDIGLTQATVQIVSIETTMTNGVATSTLVLGGYTPDTENAIRENDLLTIGYNQGYRFVNKATHNETSQKFQVRATANADSDSDGEIEIVVSPGIIWDDTNPLQNINKAIDGDAISDGVDVTVAMSHKCGIITCSRTIYSPMPRMPSPIPYPGSSGYDKNTGASSRIYGGQRGVGTAAQGWVMDGLQGVAMQQDCNMRILIPLTQGS